MKASTLLNSLCLGSLTALISIVCGCGSYFTVSPMTSDSEIRVMPTWDGQHIPVYWRNGSRFQPPKPEVPSKPYVVVGFVSGEAGVLSIGIHGELVEQQFRWAAAAIKGDAVIDAHATHFFGPAPIKAFQGDVVRWITQDATTSRPGESCEKQE